MGRELTVRAPQTEARSGTEVIPEPEKEGEEKEKEKSREKIVKCSLCSHGTTSKSIDMVAADMRK